MKSDYSDGTLTLFLSGRIDSSNADQVEHDILNESSTFENIDVAFDASDLEYISSAGLRVLLKVKKRAKKDIVVRNVSDEVFDIFDVTGFADIFVIERQMRLISLKGCRKISSALNGEIYQLSDDEMIKVFDRSIPLNDVKKERATAQNAMVYGVPTLIPYDVVKCEYGYGIVFEKAPMTSLSYLISHNPNKLQMYAVMLAKLLKELHATEVPNDKFPSIKDRYMGWVKEVDDPNDSKVAMFSSLIDSIPEKTTYVHGNINLNSVMVQNDELLLLDMSGSAYGNPLFDLQALFASLVGIESKNEGYCRKTFGITKAACIEFWKYFFDKYMDSNEQEIKAMNSLLAKYFVLKENVLNEVEKKHQLGSQE